MKITFKRSFIVKPAEPTFNGYMPLSILDQADCITHTPFIYFYRHIDLQMLDIDNIVNDIKSSLSKVLVHFYPLAGRLHYIEGGGNRIELDCNGKGVELIEAKCDGKLEELGDNFPPSSHFYHFFPCIDYKNCSIEELPLLYVQLTRFQCGGLALSITISHVMADGVSASHFFMEWSRIARGASQPNVQPFHDRKALAVNSNYNLQPFHQKKLEQEYQSPPLLISQSSNKNERNTPRKSDLLQLNKHQVEALKNKANIVNLAPEQRPYSRYEVIVAHVWRSVCKAHRLANEQQTRLAFTINIRRHMDPPLPPAYFGNVVIDVCAFAICGELLSNSLTYGANIIREAILQVTSEYVNSAISFLENQKDLSEFQDLHAYKNDEGPVYGNPNLEVISWLSLQFHQLDLGWGKSIYIRPVTLDSDGQFIVLPSHENDGSVLVSFSLQQQHMEDFIKLFYQHDDEESVGSRF